MDMLAGLRRMTAGGEAPVTSPLPDGYIWHRETVRRAEAAFNSAWSRWQLAPGVSAPGEVDDAWRQLRATWGYLLEVEHRSRTAAVWVQLDQETGKALAMLAPLWRRDEERGDG